MKRSLFAILLIVALLAQMVPLASASEPVIIRFSWWGDETRHRLTLDAISKFEEANPDIKIEPEYQGWDDYHTKLKTQIAGGTAPDVMQTDVKEMPSIVTQDGVFADISALNIDLGGFDMTFVENWGKRGDEIIGLPTGINGETAIFNAELCEKAGIAMDSPMTWDDILTIGKAFRASNPDSYMILLDPAQVQLHILNAYLAQISGTGIFNDDHTRNFDEADLAMVLGYIRDLLENEVLVPFEQSSVYSINQMENPLWLDGKVAMYLNFTTHVSSAQANSPFEIATGLFPSLAGGKQSGIIVQPAQLITISAKTAHPEEAARFVDFFFNDPESVIALQLNRSVPAVKSARELLESRGELNAVLNEAVDRALAHIGAPFSVLAYNSELVAIMIAAVESIGYKTATPEEAAANAIRQIDAKLSEL